MIRPYASITWGKNSRGRPVPIAVSYDDLVIETKTIVRRDIRASTKEREVKQVSLPLIAAFEKFIELSEREIAAAQMPRRAPQAEPAKAPAPHPAHIKRLSLARIKAAHIRLQNAGLMPASGDQA